VAKNPAEISDHQFACRQIFPGIKAWPGRVFFSLTLLGLILFAALSGGFLPLSEVVTALMDHPPAVSPAVGAHRLRFDGEAAYQHVLAQVELGPRPTGSAAGWATGDLILTELQKAG
jgi:hypothetical protein